MEDYRLETCANAEEQRKSLLLINPRTQKGANVVYYEHILEFYTIFQREKQTPLEV